MPLTIEQQQRVIQHLEQKQAGTQCQICKKGDLKVHPEMVCTPLAESNRGEIKIYARDVVSLVHVVLVDKALHGMQKPLKYQIDKKITDCRFFSIGPISPLIYPFN